MESINDVKVFVKTNLATKFHLASFNAPLVKGT